VTFKPEIFGSMIVAVGSFNPAIFSPDWLKGLGLIGEGDREAALQSEDSFVLTKQVSAFETDWFGIQVLDNQLTLASKGALTPAVRDLAQGIFHLLPHTPVTALGLNFFGHFPMGSEEAYHKVGDTFVPKSIWRKAFPGEHDAGMADLHVFVRKGKRSDPATSQDRYTVQIQPSSKVKLGVFLALNDHRADAFAKEKRAANAKKAGDIVAMDWDATWQESEQAFERLLTSALAD